MRSSTRWSSTSQVRICCSTILNLACSRFICCAYPAGSRPPERVMLKKYNLKLFLTRGTITNCYVGKFTDCEPVRTAAFQDAARPRAGARACRPLSVRRPRCAARHPSAARPAGGRRRPRARGRGHRQAVLRGKIQSTSGVSRAIAEPCAAPAAFSAGRAGGAQDLSPAAATVPRGDAEVSSST